MSEPITKASKAVSRIIIEGTQYHVGFDGVTAIEPYNENGQMAHVAWFNVWRGTTLYCKVNAAYVVVVEYQP